ncbi:response regulator [Altericista sp. CCNU0014]|uniref:ATP-binding response regulator n=1 Tax=Altericista sp. CCNU0014 TaxID=3082949 RepID=UPI00384DE575
MDRILVVDDTPDNLALIEIILEDEGYELILVSSGAEALAEVDRLPPDLILLDIMMPEMNGYEVTRRVRQNSKLPYIPILLLTAHQTSDVVEGLESGADDFVRKPVDVDELAARVRSLLRLKHSIDEREQLALQRQDFIAHLTHDLRTPLVAADKMLKLFQQEAFCPISPDMHQAISAMIRSNYHLMQIVDTLLEVQCYEAGAKTLTFIPCNLREIVEEVVQELKHLAEGKGLTLTIEPSTQPESTPVKVLGDYLELRRMLTNLVGNAIKFTEEGSIEIGITAPPPGDRIVLIVRDTGAGLSPQELERMFQRFHKGTHQQSGSGLGLHLVSRIVQAHKGTIKVDSQPNCGSAFTIYLPAY